MKTRFVPENRYHAALHEKPEDDLIGAIRRGQADADACKQELYRRGWTDEHIAQAHARAAVRIRAQHAAYVAVNGYPPGQVTWLNSLVDRAAEHEALAQA